MNIPYGQGPGEAPPDQVTIPDAKWKALRKITPQFSKYWLLKDVYKDDAVFKLSVAAYIAKFTEAEVRTMLWIMHRKHGLAFDVNLWAAEVRPNAIKKSLRYTRTNHMELEGHTKIMWCVDSKGRRKAVRFDETQNFVRNPLELEWVLDDAGTCVAKGTDMAFPYLFQELATDPERLYLRDGDSLNLSFKNIMRESYMKDFNWPVEPKLYWSS